MTRYNPKNKRTEAKADPADTYRILNSKDIKESMEAEEKLSAAQESTAQEKVADDDSFWNIKENGTRTYNAGIGIGQAADDSDDRSDRVVGVSAAESSGYDSQDEGYDDDYDYDEEPDVKNVKRKRRKWPIVLACVLGGLVLIVAGLLVAVHIVTGGFRSTRLNNEDLGIVETTTVKNAEKTGKITNIAFFGIDTRDWLEEIGDQYRSDSIIIVSINSMNNTIKMTSILRDTKAPVQGYGAVKINSAYQKGGPTLAIHTLNTNFKLDIADYVTVDFKELAQAIDVVGGVDIELTYNEAEMVNFYAMDEMQYYGSFATEGMNHLNGAQAVSYARIRNIDTDVYRASRQQTVLTALLDKVKSMPKSDYPSMITQLLGCVETSLSYADIISLVSSIDVSNVELIKNTVPDVNYQANIWGGYDDSLDAWVWIYDLDVAAERIHTIIYGTEGNGEGETEVPTVDPKTSDITY